MRKNGGKKWITYIYPAGYNSDRIFENDPLIIFKQIWMTVSERLQKEHNYNCEKFIDMEGEK